VNKELRPYITRFFKSKDSSPNVKESYVYCFDVTFIDDIETIKTGDTFPFVIMNYHLYNNTITVTCYNDFIDWRDHNKPFKKFKTTGI